MLQLLVYRKFTSARPSLLQGNFHCFKYHVSFRKFISDHRFKVLTCVMGSVQLCKTLQIQEETPFRVLNISPWSKNSTSRVANNWYASTHPQVKVKTHDDLNEVNAYQLCTSLSIRIDTMYAEDLFCELLQYIPT